MIDVSKYEKIGEFRDGEMKWSLSRSLNIVYLIIIGDDSYVGSAKNIHRRFSQYISALRKGKYQAKKIQEAFDKNKSFDVYALDHPNNEFLRRSESRFIKDLNPTLNSRKDTENIFRGEMANYGRVVWGRTHNISCPNCGQRFPVKLGAVIHYCDKEKGIPDGRSGEKNPMYECPNCHKSIVIMIP